MAEAEKTLTKLYGPRVEGANPAGGLSRREVFNARALLAGTTKALTRLCQASEMIAACVEAERAHANAELSDLYGSGSSAMARMASDHADTEASRQQIEAQGKAVADCLLASVKHAEEDKELSISALLARLREQRENHEAEVARLRERLRASQSAASELAEQNAQLVAARAEAEAALSLQAAEWRSKSEADESSHALHVADLKREHERSIQRTLAAGSATASWFRKEAELAKAAEREAAERSETAMARAMASVRDLSLEGERLRSEQETLQREREREQAEAAKRLAKEQKLARQHLETQQQVALRRLEQEQKRAQEQLEREQKEARERLELEQREGQHLLKQEKKQL